MRLLRRIVFIAFCCCIGSHAFAQLYTGVSGGQSSVGPYLGVDDLPEIQESVGFRLFLGNRLSDKFSYEIAYVDLGSYEFEDKPETTDDTLSVTGVDVSIVGHIPIRRRILLFGRLGAFHWEGERRITDGTLGLDFVATISKTNHHAGLGAELRLHKYLGMTLEANHFRTEDLSNYLVGIGVFFTF